MISFWKELLNERSVAALRVRVRMLKFLECIYETKFPSTEWASNSSSISSFEVKLLPNHTGSGTVFQIVFRDRRTKSGSDGTFQSEFMCVFI